MKVQTQNGRSEMRYCPLSALGVLHVEHQLHLPSPVRRNAFIIMDFTTHISSYIVCLCSLNNFEKFEIRPNSS